MKERTIAHLQEGMAAGQFTARALAEEYLERIGELDPLLHALIETNPDAADLAAELDRERRERGPRGPLHGIPVLLKDNIDTADRTATTAGSLALLEAPVPARDAHLVGQLRAAGAVLLGKANLSEWANFRSTRSSSGWSARGGQTCNPYALDRNPCGSSSGSAAAVAASLCAAAVGTETDGSIVCPASTCGIVGIKPTLGLIGRSGIVPIAHSQDTAGPMARSVADAALLLAAMAGPDPRDATTHRDRALPDYAAALDPGALRGARLGVLRDFAGFHEGVDALLEEALSALREGGATLIDPVEMETAKQFGDAEYEVLLYEFKADMAAYLQQRGGPLQNLQDLIRFNEQHREREMPYFGQEIFHKAQEKGGLEEEAYRQALEKCRRLARAEGIDATLHKHRLDALVCPTSGPAGLTDLINGDHHLGGSSSPAAVAGYPHITVPAGHVFGLPVGLSFFGAAWSEVALIGLAYAYEQATLHRRPPRFLPTAEL